MSPEWLRKRRYRHLDLPVGLRFAEQIQDKNYIIHHSFLPLLNYIKIDRKYKRDRRDVINKERSISYASHKDACILSYYAYKLNNILDNHYQEYDLDKNVIAYRSLGKANYAFSADVFEYCKKNAPVTILAFDIEKFFDTLDHNILKNRLRYILNTNKIPEDWYKIFKFITNFHFISINDIRNNDILSLRLLDKSSIRIATIAEINLHKIKIHDNPEIANGSNRGIPQGTPISASISNLYMIEFDKIIKEFCNDIGALYRRYSDDILIACKAEFSDKAQKLVADTIVNNKLQLSKAKTERVIFNSLPERQRSYKPAQYLGFMLDESGAFIRPNSLARQWRKMRRAMRRATRAAYWRHENGKSGIVSTRKLYRKFSYIKFNDGTHERELRNFLSYGRRSATYFGPGEKITQQIRRFERAAAAEIQKLKKIQYSHPLLGKAKSTPTKEREGVIESSPDSLPPSNRSSLFPPGA